jgi:DNA polymerase sigma
VDGSADVELAPPEVCRRVGAALEAAGAADVAVRDTARVPIVLFADPATGLDCDVSTHNPLALRNTALLRAYAKVDGRVRGLAYVVKRWAKARGVNSPSDGTLSSYGYVLAVLAYRTWVESRASALVEASSSVLLTSSRRPSRRHRRHVPPRYLQAVPRPPILPSLQRLDADWPGPKDPRRPPPARERHPFDDSRDVCLAFHEPNEASLPELRAIAARNTQSLGELLAGFFRHYAWRFDYRASVVSPRTACALPKANKAELDCWPMSPMLAIEDPFETHYDVGAARKLRPDSPRRLVLEAFALASTRVEGPPQVAHVLKYPKFQLLRKEFMRASALVDKAAAGDADPEKLLAAICEPLPEPEPEP